MEIKDLVGLSQPLTKLVEVVSSAVGTLYRPKAIRNEADAQAYAKLTLDRAATQSDIEAKQLHLTAAIDRTQQALQDNPALAERARQRLLTREVEGQLNVESIADFASETLPSAVSSEPINSDWRRKFFQEAENICDADMQLLWGKVLAGEIAAPGRYSTRTLDTLRQLTRVEAELFRNACSIAMDDGWIAMPSDDVNSALKLYGLSYSDVLSLRDAGLLLNGDSIHKSFDDVERKPDGSHRPVTLQNNGVLIEISGPSISKLQVPALVFTRAGRELQHLIDQSMSPGYLSALAISLRAHGLAVKRGTFVPQGSGLSVIVYEQDL